MDQFMQVKGQDVGLTIAAYGLPLDERGICALGSMSPELRPILDIR